MNPSSTYLRNLFAIVVMTYVSIVLIQYGLYSNNLLPAKPVSSSLSFNEKLGWMSKLDTINCDVLLTGSSLALNNTDSSVYQSYANNKFINIASWGMTISDNNEWLRMFMSVCEPKKVILLMSSNDFRTTSSSDMKNFDSESILAILNHTEQAFDSIDIKNIYYILKNVQKIDEEKSSSDMKGSLLFDSGGSVPIAFKDWSLEDSWLKGFVPPEKIDDSTYDALRDLLKILNEKKIEVLVVLSPIRRDVLNGNKHDFSVFVDTVKNITNEHNVDFVNLTRSDNFLNEDYLDVTHLNQRGARKLSGMIVEHLLMDEQ